MTSSIVARMSKKRRIPDGGTSRTRWLRARSERGARSVGSLVWEDVIPARIADPHPGRRDRRSIIRRGTRR
jgi:hypothetical protein